MGKPMAMRLANANIPLVVWSRSPSSTEAFRDTDTVIANSVTDLFKKCGTVVLMLGWCR